MSRSGFYFTFSFLLQSLISEKKKVSANSNPIQSFNERNKKMKLIEQNKL